jgi:hypothetical protein
MKNAQGNSTEILRYKIFSKIDKGWKKGQIRNFSGRPTDRPIDSPTHRPVQIITPSQIIDRRNILISIFEALPNSRARIQGRVITQIERIFESLADIKIQDQFNSRPINY